MLNFDNFARYILVFAEFRIIYALYNNVWRAGRRGDRGSMPIGKGLAARAAWGPPEAPGGARADGAEEQAADPAEELA